MAPHIPSERASEPERSLERESAIAPDAEFVDRYSRQILFAGIGREGQQRLRTSHVAVVGCGALGSAQAILLARAGVGRLTLVDRDYVEGSNLQRQLLFTEDDAEQGRPKALAAADAIRTANSSIVVEAAVEDVTSENVERILSGAAVLLDGTDNFETRYLINDFAVAHSVPWIYGAAVGSAGVSFTVRPGMTACLECVFGERPAGLVETCDTVGVLGWAVTAIGSVQVSECVKLLVGAEERLRATLLSLDLWQNEFRQIRRPPPDPNCRACARRDFVYLRGERRATITLCGRDSVQIHERSRPIAFAELQARLAPHGRVRYNDYALRFWSNEPGVAAGFELTVFPNGRAIIKGTTDTALARSLYARYIGS
jgi:molybdopterin/thiamine biosynthesis adenylyltransferase